MHPTTRPRTALAVLSLAALAGVALPITAAWADRPRPLPARAATLDLGHADEPRQLPSAPGDDAQHVVIGDMVVTLVGDARTNPVPVGSPGAERTTDDAHDAGHDHDDREGPRQAADGETGGTSQAATGGYTAFSSTARLARTGYVIRLAGSDARIEQYRPELAAAAEAASAASGVPVRVAPGVGGPVAPATGEIVAVVGSGPCGTDVAGCGGPTLSTTEVVSGRVWIDPSSLGLAPAMRANLAAHELGHALGLAHHEDEWTDGRQVMHPRLHGTAGYRAGDSAGLRWLGGAEDRPAGALGPLTYAAGQLHVEGTLDDGSQVRLSSGDVVADVDGSGGRFAGALQLPAGTHRVCARVLDAGAGYRRDLGCVDADAPGMPFGKLDGGSDSPLAIRVTGWAADPQTASPVRVEIRRDGVVVGRAAADRPRSDLGAVAVHYGDRHGFEFEVPPLPGTNRLCVLVLGVGDGGDLDLGCRDVHHPIRPTAASSAPPAPLVSPVVDAIVAAPAPVLEVVGRVVDASARGPLSGLVGTGSGR